MRNTEPKLNKGKKPQFIPKGSSLEKEWAKNIWYIGYSFNGKQYRIKQDINRITDYKEKRFYADVLIQSLKDSIDNGFNPEDPEAFINSKIRTDLMIGEAVDIYLADLQKHTRSKTHQSYQSKLRYFVEENVSKQLNEIDSNELKRFIRNRINKVQNIKIHREGKTFELDRKIAWTNNTVRSARGIFRAFFNWCISEGYYKQANPMSKVPLKEIHSENQSNQRNVPFSAEDNSKIMKYLDENDQPIAFFCRFLYHTCLRPGELIRLKIKDLDFKRRKIIVPLNVSKNTKRITEEEIYMTDELLNMLIKHGFQNADSDNYVVTDCAQFYGQKTFGRDTPYKRFKKAIKRIGIDNKGYVLYSFKHFANISRFRQGWKIEQLMVANRHANLAMTLEYLKDINNDTSIAHLTTPEI